jgi:hypothetical protein
MDIEVISFYLNHADEDGSFFSGTLHIRLLGEYDLDVRGIIVIMKDENWNFFMPNKIVDVDGKKVRYPIVSFSDREKTKDLLRIVIEKGKEFVSKKMS